MTLVLAPKAKLKRHFHPDNNVTEHDLRAPHSIRASAIRRIL
jgi:hypothetical protein